MLSIPFRIRILHIILFELIALLIATPIASIVVKHDLTNMFILTVAIATIATLWNLIFNILFDIIEGHFGRDRKKRGPLLRIVHSCLFEAGLLIITLPFIVYWLDMEYIEAIILDIGFIIFYLVYAYFFNWIFDTIYFKMKDLKDQK
jgi:uncharacterized membrane protein